MAEREQFLASLIAAATGGDADALSELSSIALGGNETAQSAIRAIDSKGHTQRSAPQSGDKPIVWPKEVESGERGPRKGDIPLHNNL